MSPAQRRPADRPAVAPAAAPQPPAPRSRPRGAPAALDASHLEPLLGYALARASIEMKRAFKSRLGPLGLREVEFSILVLVASNPRVNQRQLGRALDLSAPNMAITLDRLAEAGWIERVRSTEDRRAQIIGITAAGRQLAQRAEEAVAVVERQAATGLSQAERLLLIELLLKVARCG